MVQRSWNHLRSHEMCRVSCPMRTVTIPTSRVRPRCSGNKSDKKIELSDYHLRAERQDRENRRWNELERKNREEEAWLHDLRLAGTKTRKNISGSPFNPITGKIDDTDSGAALRKRDDMTRQRAYDRTMRMTKASNSPFNPITGADYIEQPRPIPTAY